MDACRKLRVRVGGAPIMGNAMANQGACSREGAGVREERKCLAAYRQNHGSIEIDQVGMGTGSLLSVIDTMRVVADRARRSTTGEKMSAVSPKRTGGIFLEGGIT